VILADPVVPRRPPSDLACPAHQICPDPKPLCLLDRPYHWRTVETETERCREGRGAWQGRLSSDTSGERESSERLFCLEVLTTRTPCSTSIPQTSSDRRPPFLRTYP
jgi:hypothetical protein